MEIVTAVYFAEPSNRQLHITTSKRWNGDLVTSASVHHKEGEFLSHKMPDDFSKYLQRSKHARVTARIIQEVHDKIMPTLDELVKEASDFYVVK
jgi:hypothetical protein